MAEQTANAPAEDLAALSDRQRRLDLEALQRLEEARALLDDPFNPLADQTDMMAPWMAPLRGRRAPVEQDTPEEDPDEPREQSDQTNDADDAQDAGVDWWDRPADLNDLMQSFIEEDERFADRHRPVDRRSQDPNQDGAISPRELFQQHQQAIAHAGLDHRADDPALLVAIGHWPGSPCWCCRASSRASSSLPTASCSWLSESSRNWPDTTTCSSSARPESTSVRGAPQQLSPARPVVMVRDS